MFLLVAEKVTNNGRSVRALQPFDENMILTTLACDSGFFLSILRFLAVVIIHVFILQKEESTMI